jgi:hypothetical protein
MALLALLCALLAPGVALAEGGIGYELRQEITGVLIPSHPYAVSGSCASGTGPAPASGYVHGRTGSGSGIGGGLGGRAFYEEAPGHPNALASTWWGLRVGAGLDVDLLYAKVPTDTSGRLCPLVTRPGADVQYVDSPVLLLQIPAILGGELGLRTGESPIWRGIVLGWAWAPALTILKPWVTNGRLDVSVLGSELTMDFAAGRGTVPQEAGKRVAVFLLLPTTDGGPAVMTLSFGGVWQ